MIRQFKKNDLPAVMQIWLDTNIKAHDFIPKEYWENNYEIVKEILPDAEIYVHEDDTAGFIDGFIGLTNNYIAGIFVKEDKQSKGIGKKLLNYVKNIKPNISLSVYQKNTKAVRFYKREQFKFVSENVDDIINEKEFIMEWNK